MADGQNGGRQATAAPHSASKQILRTFGSAVLVTALSGGTGVADVTFKSDSDIVIVRGRQSLGFAIYEVLGSRDGQIQCVAVDSQGKPLAVTNGYTEHSAIMFQELDFQLITNVTCRYVE